MCHLLSPFDSNILNTSGSVGLQENNIDYFIQEDWRTIKNQNIYCVGHITQVPVNFSWIGYEKYLEKIQLNISKDLKPTVRNQTSPDSSVGVWNIISILFGCLSIIALSTFILVVVFRKRIEYRVYRIKQTLRLDRRHPGNRETGRPFLPENKKYDVYLSYSEEDYPWVRKHFLSHIDEWETEENNASAFGKYKIYCSDRDSHHGKSELENMCENIELSRVAVVVLSSSYTQKHLHTVELEHLLYSKDISVIQDIVIIMIEELKFKQIPRVLHKQIKKDKFLRWEVDETKEKKFYEDLIRFLK